MFNQDLTIFAETTYRNELRKFGIKKDDRRRHMYMIGKTGMGKSTILENMIVNDIRAGRGVAVVDPHGDLVEKVIEFIPQNRVNDVVYFNPSDFEYPIAFNVVEQVEPHLRHLVASGLIGVFQKLWADSWGPRLEYILRNAILAVLDYPGSTLLAVTRMLSDKEFRKKVVENIQDPVVRAFWVNEFAGYADKFASEAVSPIQNKVGQFLSTSLVRNIIGQVRSTIDIRKVMDEGKILLMNLSKGRIGEDNSALLGAMMITKIQLAAMSRVDLPESERKDFYLYVDEFQNFATDSFANILSEARKYRLNLVLAHQYIEQLPETVASAIFGNVGTLILFRVGAADAEVLMPEFMPTFTSEDIVNLPKYEIYLKLMIDGIASEPFSARGLKPLNDDEKTNNLQKVIAVSRERYAKDRKSVEEKINQWHESENETIQRENLRKENARLKKKVKKSGTTFNPQINMPSTQPRPNTTNNQNHTTNSDTDGPTVLRTSTPNQPVAVNQITTPSQIVPTQSVPPTSTQAPPNSVYQFETNCSRCTKATRTSFKPDGVRPVYCKDCLSIAREEKKAEIEARKIAKRQELENLNTRSTAPTQVDSAPLQANAPSHDNENTITLDSLKNTQPVKFKNTKNQTNQSTKPEQDLNEEQEVDF